MADKHTTGSAALMIAAFVGVPLAGALFVLHLSSKRKTLKAGKSYQVAFTINPPLPTPESIEAFKKGLINTGATSLNVSSVGGSYITNPQADTVMVLGRPEFTTTIQGVSTSVIPMDVKEI